MSDLVSGLLAKLSDVEKLANDCIAEVGSTRAGDEYADGSGAADSDSFPSYPWGSMDRELAFMAGPGHPDDVLRLCRAHRDIISEYLRLKAEFDAARVTPPDVAVFVALGTQVRTLKAVLGALARGLGVEEQTSE